METNTLPPDRGNRVGLFVFISGMLVTFILGVFVGLHPTWLPFKTTSEVDFSSPSKTLPHTTTTRSTTGR